MTTLPARYSSIGFVGARAERTFVTLSTPQGEIRAFVDSDPLKRLFTSRNIGKSFQVTLDDIRAAGYTQESTLLDASPL
jgi:hypothetical protein